MKFVIQLAFSLAVSLGLAWLIQLFVNYLFAAQFLLFVFGVAKITFWQGFVLRLVVGLLTPPDSSRDKA